MGDPTQEIKVGIRQKIGTDTRLDNKRVEDIWWEIRVGTGRETRTGIR